LGEGITKDRDPISCLFLKKYEGEASHPGCHKKKDFLLEESDGTDEDASNFI